ncbi:hypothetical protein Tco_0025973 [Tanacetum coccineum]
MKLIELGLSFNDPQMVKWVVWVVFHSYGLEIFTSEALNTSGLRFLNFFNDPRIIREQIISSYKGYRGGDMALPPRDKRQQYLRFEGLGYIDADITDFEERLEQMAEGLSGRMLMEHRDAQGQSVFSNRAWTRIFEIRGLLIACNIARRSQAPEKVTVTDLFYLRGMDVCLVNIPYLLARYLRLFALGKKYMAMISEVTEGAPDIDEGDQAVPAPVQVPQPPPTAGPTMTMEQRLGRLEEGVHGLRGALGEQRENQAWQEADLSKDLSGPELPPKLRRSWCVEGHIRFGVISSVLMQRTRHPNLPESNEIGKNITGSQSPEERVRRIQKRSFGKQNLSANHEGKHKSINRKRFEQGEQVWLRTIVGMIRGNTSKKRPREQSEQWLDNEISFPSTPGCQLVDSPIILEALIEGFLVRRIYVDGGNSSEVMYEHCFRNFGAETRAKLKESKTPLVGFSSEGTTSTGREEIQWQTKEEKEPKETVQPPPNPPEKDTQIDEEIEGKDEHTERFGIIEILRKHANAFAWTPADMTGIPHVIVEHKLKMCPPIEPRVQRKRSIAPDRRNVVKEEVAEWLKAKIVRKV